MLSFKDCILVIRSFIVWMCPFLVFLGSLLLFCYFFKSDLIELVKVLVWPFTVLTILYFFRKVVAYLFFSMNEFNFFGINGSLKNVNDMIKEQVERKIGEKESEDKRNEEINKLKEENNTVKGNDESKSQLIEKVFSSWEKTIEKDEIIISGLENENKRLKGIISSLPSGAMDASFSPSVNEKQTSDPILEDSNIEK